MAATEAVSLGYGGISVVRRACGLSRKAIRKGIGEIQARGKPLVGRIRRPGAGRKSISESDPGLVQTLEGLIDVEGEKVRLAKKITETELEIQKVEQKLNNPAFVQKVPQSVLDEHQKRLADWQAKLAQFKSSLDALQG